MRPDIKCISFVLGFVFISSCNVIEKSSRHELESGYYKVKPAMEFKDEVYLDISDESVAVYPKLDDLSQTEPITVIHMTASDSLCHYPMVFKKRSLDIDITTNLFKYRPALHGLPAQLNADFNAAIYTGWRFDHYRIGSKKSPLGKCRYDIINRGFDFGLFAGPGTTLIGPFTTNNIVQKEYNGMILQYGIAIFLESNVASFGISSGFDHLLSQDRKIWLYNKKPWIGFIVGIALN